jgi:hypothetical protein
MNDAKVRDLIWRAESAASDLRESDFGQLYFLVMLIRNAKYDLPKVREQVAESLQSTRDLASRVDLFRLSQRIQRNLQTHCRFWLIVDLVIVAPLVIYLLWVIGIIEIEVSGDWEDKKGWGIIALAGFGCVVQSSRILMGVMGLVESQSRIKRN